MCVVILWSEECVVVRWRWLVMVVSVGLVGVSACTTFHYFSAIRANVSATKRW